MEFISNNVWWMVWGVAAVAVVTTVFALLFRRVVPTNEVHVVQSAKRTTSYGKDTGNGNTYYEWPHWIPILGVRREKFPVSVFTLALNNYEAYDQGRLPFQVDVAAFFRVEDSGVAAQRVASFRELTEQLQNIVQGAIRSILASNDIETILNGRATFGDQFTNAVQDQLKNWGVTTVKNIELMDIRDSNSSQVIRNIMEKKKSHIEMESRTEVARNRQVAAIAEIEAQQKVDIQKQDSAQTVGLRTVEAERQVELQKQAKAQAIKEQERTTKEREMQILEVENTRKAAIAKQVAIVQTQQQAETQVLLAQSQKDSAVLQAEAALEFKRREAEGITLEGTAKAEAAKAMELAPVQAQITLAKEIGSNKEYQEYLVTVRKVEAQEKIGVAQAESLKAADIKVIANTGNVSSGMDSLGDLFTSKGGTGVGAMLEGLANTEVGGALVKRLTGTNGNE